MRTEKYESITGIELPQKVKTTKKIFKVHTYQAMRNVLKNSSFDGLGWGRAVNNSCELRKFKNGVEVEAYYIFGNLMSVFILK